jgi:hypothetical protein
MTAFSSNGEQKQGTQWYDNELDIVVKQEYQNDIVDELRNIKIDKVSKDLFVIPGDYALYDATLTTAHKSTESIVTDDLVAESLGGVDLGGESESSKAPNTAVLSTEALSAEAITTKSLTTKNIAVD